MVTLHKRKYGHELSIILIVTFHQYTDSRYKSFSENCFHANHSLVTFFLFGKKMLNSLVTFHHMNNINFSSCRKEKTTNKQQSRIARQEKE